MEQTIETTDLHPDVFYSNGAFLIFNEDHAMKLRRHRIVGHLIGCAPKSPHQIVTSGLPYLINNYAAAVVYVNKLANFKQLRLKESVKPEERLAKCSDRFSRIKEEARREFEEKQTGELKKRNIELSPSRMKHFDEKKLRLTVPNTIDSDCSSFEQVVMNPTNLFNFKDHKMIVFKDLYNRGFHVSCGMKFGSDFLVYLGDPIRYHAQYAVRVVANVDNRVDICRLAYNEINALQRLCHNAKKISLLAVVCAGSEEVNYWTLKDREYLSPDSSTTIFEPMDLKLNSI